MQFSLYSEDYRKCNKPTGQQFFKKFIGNYAASKF